MSESKAAQFHKLLGVKETFEVPEKMLSVLLDPGAKETFFEEFERTISSDHTKDWFFEYFQEEHGDRKNKKQDFTPECLTDLMQRLSDKEATTVADVCAGIGGLTLQHINSHHAEFYECEEITAQALPILLFNLAIRNANGLVKHGDSLTGEVYNLYAVTKGKKYSDITKNSTDISDEDEEGQRKYQQVISNPPYSLNWEHTEEIKRDKRFSLYGLAPKSKADYAFILHILDKLEENGGALIILPHGVLFRGSAEGDIRKKLVEENVIDAVIGLPDKLFLNTSIPTFILKLKKKKEDKKILFIDASKEFKNLGKQNQMEENHLKKIIGAVEIRGNIEKYSYLASMEEIRENEYNLNIPRYVDTFEEEILPDFQELLAELTEIDQEIDKTHKELYRMMQNLTGTTEDGQKKVDAVQSLYKKRVERIEAPSEKKEGLAEMVQQQLEF